MELLPNEQAITEPITDNVFQLFDPVRKPRPDERGTAAELEEYRRIKPLLLQMLREWQIAKDHKHGCAILANVLAPPLTR